ncbi:MAG: hypothetical protein ACRDKX_07540 [Solirubrobacterales bacterium]
MRTLLGRFFGGSARLTAEIVAAIAIGAGVPLLWIWIGSVIQGSRNAQAVEASTVVAMMVGILVTYAVVLYVAAWLQGRGSDQADSPPVRYPWNRSMRDEPYRPGTAKLSPVEAVFVVTAVVASIAMMIWFFAFAGSPLPN